MTHKNIIYFFSLFFLFSICFTDLFSDENSNFKKNTKIVVIDAGHGGKDSGARGKNAMEKDIVLAISLKLGKYIEENIDNVKVIYTRTDDTFIELHKRAQIANSNKADLFISIHVNSNKNTKPFGTETYAMGLHKTKGNLDVAKKENSVIMIEDDYSTKYEGFDPNSPESYIIFSLMQNVFLDQSLDFASHVQDEFELRAQRYNRGVKQAGFLVLWKTTMPSVLVEAGFISNAEEEKYLMTETGQDYLASAIYRAVKDYLKKMDNTNSSLNEKNAIVETDTVKTVKEALAQDKIVFSIQIASSTKSIEKDSDFFKDLTNIKEIKINKTFKYTVSEHANYDTTLNELAMVRTKFPDAFVVAYENEKRINLREALKKTGNKK